MSRFRALLTVVGAIASLITASIVAAPPALAMPSINFQMPFPCGETWHASTYGGHNAIDWNVFPSGNGRAVTASAAGTATLGYQAGTGWGYYVTINHGNGWQTRYAHLQEGGRASGAVVAGAVIGFVGNSGTTNAHLHWEQIYDNERQSVLYAGGFALSPGTTHTSADPSYTSKNCALRTGAWYLRNSNSGGSHDSSRQFGAVGDVPVAGDWDGNGTETVGVFRPSEGKFYLSNSSTSQAADIVTSFGVNGDIPVVGDWDFEGTTTIGVFRPSTGTFYLSNSNTTGAADYVFQYGATGDVPVAGDWNGDGFVTVGVFRPSNATWYLRNSNTGGGADISVGFGAAGDIPVAGDWDFEGTTTIGVYRPSSQTFYLSNSNTTGAADYSFQYGAQGDVPVTGDWNADGFVTIGVGR